MVQMWIVCAQNDINCDIFFKDFLAVYVDIPERMSTFVAEICGIPQEYNTKA